MQATDNLTRVRTSGHTDTSSRTIHYYVGRDRLLDDGKWLRGELIKGPFYEPEVAKDSLARCGEEAARIIKVTTYCPPRLRHPMLSATHMRKAFHGFTFDMPDGSSQLFTAEEAMSAPWYCTLPADDRESIEWWAEAFARKGWDAHHVIHQ